MRSRESEADRLRAEIEELRTGLVAAESEAGSLRAELADARAGAAEELRSVAVLASQLEEMRITARGDATRIRLCALREAAAVNARLLDASDPRADEVRDRMLDALEPSRRCRLRCVVVWRPLESDSRIAAVSCTARPASVFTSVDLPTPDEPSSATV